MLTAAPPSRSPGRRRHLLWAVLLLALVPACSDDGGGGDAGPHDQGLEPVNPPDFVVNDGGGSANIGAPCDPLQGDKQCVGGAQCLDLSGGDTSTKCELPGGKGCGVCVTSGCTVEDNETPAQEDTCPAGTVCTVLPVVSGSETFCLRSCTPEVDKNPCAAVHAGLTCHPASIVLTGHKEVCIYPACSVDADCGNKDAINPDSICLQKSGMCLVKGDQQAKVGDPCTTSGDCGPYQSCLVEQTDSAGKTVFEGGYCTVIGCKYHQTFYDPQKPGENTYWQCPPDSKCFLMGSGQFVSFCLATNCEPTKPKDTDGCRDEASAGQYDCIELGTEKVCWLDIKSGS